ncbi:MAG TPA: tetratricopeptide repeat-containing serine protease family protein [Isosphaeraceae bacterium]|nr:tetratricopeptide repeat-containing serine protease family protein [Isosphaeraceae bacterium]
MKLLSTLASPQVNVAQEAGLTILANLGVLFAGQPFASAKWDEQSPHRESTSSPTVPAENSRATSVDSTDATRAALFARASEKMKRCVALLEWPDGSGGTGFVIDRRRRLLATAAHVADHSVNGGLVRVSLNDKVAEYHVTRVWYHPRIVRELDEGLYARSGDPRDGEVAYHTSDVAVLELGGNGPAFPDECILADEKEFTNLEGLDVGVLVHSEDTPADGSFRHECPSLDLGLGAVIRTMDHDFRIGTSAKARQWILHSAPSPEGSSGTPLFLSNGHVVGINCWSGPAAGQEEDVAEACRVDHLLQLLTFYNLVDMCAFEDANDSALEAWEPYPSQVPLSKARKAHKLVREAAVLRHQGRYRAAGQFCNEALLLAPTYAGAFLERAKVYLFYCGTRWETLNAEQRTQFATWAHADTHRSISPLHTWTEPYVFQAQAIVFMDAVSPTRSNSQRDVDCISELMTDAPLTEFERSFALNCRALSRTFLGDHQEALADYDEAIRLDPEQPCWFANRARYWKQRGRLDLSDRDFHKAEQLRRFRAVVATNLISPQDGPPTVPKLWGREATKGDAAGRP